MKTGDPNSGRGFALPLTILGVVSLFILMIGLMLMLSLERKTARSYSQSARAEMAMQSGLSDALATLTEVSSRDDALVFRLDDPSEPTKTEGTITREQFFTYGSIFDSTKGTWRDIPLFSGAMETSPASPPTAPKPNVPDVVKLTDNLKSALAAADNVKIKSFTRLGDEDNNVPRAKWVELPQATADYKIRYAWWVEDLGGKLDGRTVGSVARDTGKSTAELGLFTLFKNTLESDGAGPEDALIAKRNVLRTAASSRLVLAATDAKKIEPYLTYSPVPVVPSVIPIPTIPQGFGYTNAGKPTMELNAAVAAGDYQKIADHIKTNLPTFANRKGGFPASEDYFKTIAASIVDYADTDSDATVGAGYRGVDSYPFVNEMFDRYEWTGTSGGVVSIKVGTFVELWNPSQKDIKGTVEFENDNKHEINIPPSGKKTFSAVTYLPGVVSLPPNGFKVLFMGEKTYEFSIGAFSPSQPTFVETTTSDYHLKWNGKLVDSARGKLQRTNGTLNPGSSNRKWKGNSAPALDTSIGQMGDPRASYYINTWIFANNYDANTSWGGRNLRQGISNTNYKEVMVSRWPDRGSDSAPGVNAGSDAKLPTDPAIVALYPANQPTMAPAYISNAGYYTSLGELGNIFDPSQWLNVQQPTTASSSDAGGGCTLAVGRPEYGHFDVEGQRAAQLIDLFHIKIPSATTPVSAKINVNTASREVLRTLIAGVALKDDPVQPTLYPPKAVIVGDLFAEAVINWRNQSPLRGLSDLALVRKNPKATRNYTNPVADTEPFFGSRTVYPAPMPADTWDDAGREELFRKVIDLVSFQSKTFRIVVAGEALDAKGNVLGRATKEVQVMIEPERDAAGNLVSGGKISIRKLYEKSL